MSLKDRSVAAELGQSAVRIIEAGGYIAPSGRRVDLRDAIDRSVAGTIEHPPDEPRPPIQRRGATTSFAIENATVLDVGRRMAAAGPVAALNCASATHPGGGFRSGARAQEESIAQASALFAALDGRRMYGYHREHSDGMHSNWVIVSPGVPVFRTDAGQLLEEPWTMTIVTCAAVNARSLERDGPPGRIDEIPAVMTDRTARMLTVAAGHGVRRFILGAWGCGAFGLDGTMMADIFHDALTGPFEGVFDEIVFAITDWSPERRFIGPFKRAFGA